MVTQDSNGTEPQNRKWTPLTVSTAMEPSPPSTSTTSTPTLTTPKKKWMQRWSLQQQQEKAREPELEQDFEMAVTAAVVPTVDEGVQDISEMAAEDGEVLADANTHSDHNLPDPVPGLRVTMPRSTEASTLSPSTDRASPTAAATSASISPSANKVNAQSRTPSPAKLLAEEATKVNAMRLLPPTRATSSSSSSSSLTSTESFSDDPAPTADAVTVDADTNKRKQRELPTVPDTPPNQQVDEDSRPPLTESERLRLERRKKKKSNWDVGDPRKNGGTLDLAALNLLSSTNAPASHPASFAKFPRQRPTFRNSHSLDSKESPYQHRAQGFSNSTTAIAKGAPLGSPPSSAPTSLPPPVGRRPFYHSSSLPVDPRRSLSRPPPPPSARYPPPAHR